MHPNCSAPTYRFRNQSIDPSFPIFCIVPWSFSSVGNTAFYSCLLFTLHTIGIGETCNVAMNIQHRIDMFKRRNLLRVVVVAISHDKLTRDIVYADYKLSLLSVRSASMQAVSYSVHTAASCAIFPLARF